MAVWSQQSFSSPEILVHAEGFGFESGHWLLFLYLYSVFTNKKFFHPSSLSYVCALVQLPHLGKKCCTTVLKTTGLCSSITVIPL